MIFIVTKNKVRRKYADEWVSLVDDFTTATRAEPGNLFFDWYRSVDDPTVYVLVEAFQDKAAGEAHVELGPLQGRGDGALRGARRGAGDRQRRGGRRLGPGERKTGSRQLKLVSVPWILLERAPRPSTRSPPRSSARAMETVCFEMATFVSRTATTPILNQSNERNATILDSSRPPRGALGRDPAVHAVVDAAGAVLPRVLRRTSCTRATCSSPTTRTHGGGHLPDFNVFSPVFAPDGELLLIASIQCHHGDTGGALAGGYNVLRQGHLVRGHALPAAEDRRARARAARRRADDARQQPARRVHRRPARAGRRRAARCRASCDELVATYGTDTIRAAVDTTIDDTKRRFRQEISGWPDGTYEADVYVDSDPAGNTDIHVHVAITVDGDSIIVDFAGSDERPEINAWSTFGNTRGYTIAQLASLVDPTHPEERGLLRLHRPADSRGDVPEPGRRASR